MHVVLLRILRWDCPGLCSVRCHKCPYKKEAEGGLKVKIKRAGHGSDAGMAIGQRIQAASGS